MTTIEGGPTFLGLEEPEVIDVRTTLRVNGHFKIELAKRTIVRAFATKEASKALIRDPAP